MTQLDYDSLEREAVLQRLDIDSTYTFTVSTELILNTGSHLL